MSSPRRRASRPTLPLRFFRPSLEQLEDRLPPGDLSFLAGLSFPPPAPLLAAPTTPTATAPTSLSQRPAAPPPAPIVDPTPAPSSSAPAPAPAPAPIPALTSSSSNDQLFNVFGLNTSSGSGSRTSLSSPSS